MGGANGQPPAIGGAIAPPESFNVEIPLKSSWDEPLTYAVLDEKTPDADGRVFVGRMELLGPLVNAIGHPGRGGTYLISGYRGVGKTSLIIKAASQASRNLPEGWRLLPIVLNVSQVSASLGSGEDSEDAEALQISSRRLLTAMLRALHARVPQLREAAQATEPEPELPAAPIWKIETAYAKAQATSYTGTVQRRDEKSRTRTAESKSGVQLANVLKLVGIVALIVAGGAEAAAWLRTSLHQVHVIAVALAAVAVVTFTRARSITRTATTASTSSEEFVTDNSLHQLESDLQDILQDLDKARWRAVIVLEELDKIDDKQGKQLDSVIRYFKNLFTQAPAIFLFITDKQYFDFVEERIDAARRDRTYAIEHTFFTHRVFVRRPGLEDCLQFLKEVTAFDSEESRNSFHADVDAIGKHDQRVRPLEEMKPVEQFVRLLLYRSQYHFFDLKTVMRQYVQDVDGRAYLRADDTTMPQSDRALASFHFLIEQKMRNHGFVGRDYANESLQNCIFSIFEDLYSSEPQQVSRFYPREADDDLEPDQRRTVDHLDLSQRQAIEKAVDELVEDLALGQAAEVVAAGRSGGVLTWRKDAPLRFRAVARLTDYEGEAQLQVKRMVRVTELFESRDWLSDGLHPGLVTGVKDGLTAVVRSFDNSRVAQSREQVAKVVIDCEVQTAPLVQELTRRHLERLQTKVGLLTPVPGLDLAFSFAKGTVPYPLGGLLLYETFSSGAPGRSLEPLLQDSDPLAVVIVTLDNVALDDQASRTSLLAKYGLDAVERREDVLVNVVSIDQGLGHRPATSWADRTAEEILFAQTWLSPPAETPPDLVDQSRATRWRSTEFVLRASDGAVVESSLEDAVARWAASEDRVLAVPVDEEPTRAQVVNALRLGRRVAPMSRQRYRGNPSSESLIPLIQARRIVVIVERGFPFWEEVHRDLSRDRALVVADVGQVPTDERSVSVIHEKGLSPGAVAELLEQRGHETRALPLYRAAADLGDAPSMGRLVALLSKTEEDESMRWQERLIARKDAEVLRRVAETFEVDDPPRAETLHRAAAAAEAKGAGVSLAPVSSHEELPPSQPPSAQPASSAPSPTQKTPRRKNSATGNVS
jgi:KaiC/GvpD/RAD55 family RecA-like ATPase